MRHRYSINRSLVLLGLFFCSGVASNIKGLMSHQGPDIREGCPMPSAEPRSRKGAKASTGEHSLTKNTNGPHRSKRRGRSRSSKQGKESKKKSFVLKTSSIERQCWAEEERKKFVSQRSKVLRKVPASHRKLWGQIMFCKWKNDPWRPVLVLGPYQVHPDLRDVWMKMFHNVSSVGFSTYFILAGMFALQNPLD